MDASEIPDPSNAIRVGKLLGVEPRDLVDALTTKTIFAQGDSVVSLVFLIIKKNKLSYWIGWLGFKIIERSVDWRARRLC